MNEPDMRNSNPLHDPQASPEVITDPVVDTDHPDLPDLSPQILGRDGVWRQISDSVRMIDTNKGIVECWCLEAGTDDGESAFVAVAWTDDEPPAVPLPVTVRIKTDRPLRVVKYRGDRRIHKTGLLDRPIEVRPTFTCEESLPDRPADRTWYCTPEGIARQLGFDLADFDRDTFTFHVTR